MVKSTKDDFCLLDGTVAQRNPSAHNCPMFFFFFKVCVVQRARDGESGGRRRRGGDEWEWWVYWVLSGWVHAG